VHTNRTLTAKDLIGDAAIVETIAGVSASPNLFD
jgi:hypothetical protein